MCLCVLAKVVYIFKTYITLYINKQSFTFTVDYNRLISIVNEGKNQFYISTGLRKTNSFNTVLMKPVFLFFLDNRFSTWNINFKLFTYFYIIRMMLICNLIDKTNFTIKFGCYFHRLGCGKLLHNYSNIPTKMNCYYSEIETCCTKSIIVIHSFY